MRRHHRLRRISYGLVMAVAMLPVAALSACSRQQVQVTPSERADASAESAEVVPAEGFRFQEVTDSLGVDFTYRNGSEANHSAILESLGGGVAALDYDLDGSIDLCFAGGGGFEAETIHGREPGLFRNRGSAGFANATRDSRLGDALLYGHGVHVADYDSDGFPDVLFTGYQGATLWRNMGDGSFTSVTEQAGIKDAGWTSSAGWGDFDGGGNLDLYLVHYVDWSFAKHPLCRVPSGDREICSPREFSGLSDQILFSNGDGTFRDESAAAGLRPEGKGLGVLVADFDLDNDIDLYVANDTTANFLYLNDGAGRFEERGVLHGVAYDDQGIANGSMGVDLCDFNQDGLPDIWVANYEREAFALYRNEGRAQYLHASQPMGVTALGQLFVGFGTVCADFDGDGDEDIVVANGHVVKYPRAAPRRQVPLVLSNERERFRRVAFAPQSYLGAVHEGRGLAALDLENDGDLDLAVSHINEPVALLSNMHQPPAWLRVRLIGTQSNRDAIGSRLVLRTSIGELSRQIKGGASYLSSSDSRVLWSLPAGEHATELAIVWPDGTEQVVSEPQLGAELTIVQPRAK